MASHQTHGIQQLLVAEKRAAEKVAEARKRKVKRIKQARDEAQAEIEAYRKERERQFREYEARHMGSKEDVALKIDKDTEVYLKEMEKLVEDNKDKVIEELISLCKVRRLKQANEEAQLEINAYRIAREQAYERFEKAHAGNKEDVSAQIDKDIEEYIRTVDKMVQENKEKVTAELVELVFNITPAVHPNFYVLKAFNQI
ncbi:hypothetical protein D910_08272 [Dendroctonus ponderosae]|uniref:V-type proton ATPase subunit G n=1 Tax=Dendroctonus ponderosae TaxID=77166 RepID=U4UF34_DENPD|nr:hypothetical protein D910_08272 [Dendroctonus ponderosae]KAH1006290.1 hypothetical protein HUJ05_007039 [Dendroctonus ponderosae]